MKILIVDDDEDAVALLSMLLERQGWQVESATSLEDGQQALRDRAYDVLIADLHLPDGSGFNLLDGPLAAQPRGAVLVTGAGVDERRTRDGRGGFGFSLTKPINGSEIVGIIRSLSAPPAAES